MTWLPLRPRICLDWQVFTTNTDNTIILTVAQDEGVLSALACFSRPCVLEALSAVLLGTHSVSLWEGTVLSVRFHAFLFLKFQSGDMAV